MVEKRESSAPIQKAKEFIPLGTHWVLIRKCKQRLYANLLKEWCPGAESNHRHEDFQSTALPTELPGRIPNGKRLG